MRAKVVAEAERLPAHVDVTHGHQPVALLLRLLLGHWQPVQTRLPREEAVGPVAAKGNLAVFVRLQVAEEDREDGIAQGAVRLEAGNEVEVGPGGEAREAQAEDAVEGQLGEGEARLLDNAQEVHGRASPRAHVAVVACVHADLVADVLARQFASAVSDCCGIPVLPSLHRGAILVGQLHRCPGVLARKATVLLASLVRALHSG
mmetsp:Transcript_96631/g.207334  ORF Transcript_96631/g.207334 Transcript_96631/m.207334 type:complete len:204 (-) Transcript_96631:303-914(-)